MPRIAINSTIETPHVCVFWNHDGRSKIFSKWLKTNAYRGWKMGRFNSIALSVNPDLKFHFLRTRLDAVAFMNEGDAAAFRQRWWDHLEGFWHGDVYETPVFRFLAPKIEMIPELPFQFKFPVFEHDAVEAWATEHLESRWVVRKNIFSIQSLEYDHSNTIAMETLPDAMMCRLRFDFLKVISLPMDDEADDLAKMLGIAR